MQLKKTIAEVLVLAKKKCMYIYMLKLIQDKFRYKINECIISPSEKVAALISSLILTLLFIEGSVPNQ